MEYIKLGNSDLKISRIGFGCMSLSEDHPNNDKLLLQAVDLGINYFDTADLYHKGKNEETVGKAFKKQRHDVVIATKVGNQWRADGSGWDWNPTKKYIMNAVEQSLNRLQTDYIDLYQLHGGTIDDPFEQTLEAFETLKSQGKIRYYGISSIRPNVIQKWLGHSSLTSNMMQYSILDRRPEEQCLDWVHEHNVGIVTRGSLAKGLLVDKDKSKYLDYSEQDIENCQRAIKELSSTRTASQTALRFALKHKAISSAVVGIRTKKQLIEAAETFSQPDLTNEEYLRLQTVIKPSTYKVHRA